MKYLIIGLIALTGCAEHAGVPTADQVAACAAKCKAACNICTPHINPWDNNRCWCDMRDAVYPE